MEGWKRTHRWGAGTLEAYVRGVDLDRLGLEEKSGAPFVPVVCGRYQSCGSVLGTTSIPESSPESSSAITRGAWASTRGCGARHATRTRVPSSAGRRGGGAASAAARGTASSGDRRRLGRARRRKQQRRRGRGRPREAHAAAHPIRIVPVDVPSKADQPRELRLVAVICGLVHGLAHRVAHRVRRALQAFSRSDTCGLGGARGSAVTLERRRRALSRGAHAARPHAPRSSGGRGGRGARARRERSQRPRRAVEAAATPGSRGPEQRGVGVRSSGRSRPSGSTRALGNARPHEGFA